MLSFVTVYYFIASTIFILAVKFSFWYPCWFGALGFLFNCGPMLIVWFWLGSVKICHFHPTATASWWSALPLKKVCINSEWMIFNIIWESLNQSLSLKVVSATFLLVYFVYLKESTYETRKNVFNFNSKALFVLEIIKF